MKNPAIKALIDLLVSPINMGTFLLGFTSLIFNWGFLGSPIIYLFSLVSIITSIGLISTKLIFDFENLIEKAYNEQNKQKESDKIEEFYRIQKLLQEDDSIKISKEFYNLYKILTEDIKTISVPEIVLEDIKDSSDKAFYEFLKMLELICQYEKQYNLTSGKGSVKVRKLIKARREKVFENIKNSLEDFRTIVEKFHDVKVVDSEENFDKITQELHKNLEIAKKVQEEMGEIGFLTPKERE